MNFWNTWVLVSKNSNIKSIENQFRAFEVKNISEKPPCNYSLQSLSDVYLKSDQVANTGIKGNMSNIRLFSTIALVILIVAAINYIILSTAVFVGEGKRDWNTKNLWCPESEASKISCLLNPYRLLYLCCP